MLDSSFLTCPFCGHDVEIVKAYVYRPDQDEKDTYQFYYAKIGCSACGIYSPEIKHMGEEKCMKELLSFWNIRFKPEFYEPEVPNQLN
jgi:hypothetical protein